MSKPFIRVATHDDLPFINAIYNHYVLHSTATYQTEPSTPQERVAWFGQHAVGYPVIVVEDEGEVIGWGSLSKFHHRAAYQPTVENSVYVHHDRLGIGIGRMILQDLICSANTERYHSIIALISADQEASIRLHARFGFQEVARLREVGRKFDRWLDVVYMQRMV